MGNFLGALDELKTWLTCVSSDNWHCRARGIAILEGSERPHLVDRLDASWRRARFVSGLYSES